MGDGEDTRGGGGVGVGGGAADSFPAPPVSIHCLAADDQVTCKQTGIKLTKLVPVFELCNGRAND